MQRFKGHLADSDRDADITEIPCIVGTVLTV